MVYSRCSAFHSSNDCDSCIIRFLYNITINFDLTFSETIQPAIMILLKLHNTQNLLSKRKKKLNKVLNSIIQQ